MSDAPVETATGKSKGSLTGRLIWLAAIWSLIAMVLAGILLTAAFREASVSRFQGLLEAADREVVARTTVVEGIVDTAPVPDPRTLRVFSGKYWAVVEPNAEGGFNELTRSISLFDTELPPPPDGAGVILDAPGQPYTYSVPGPDGQRLTVMAVARTLPNRQEPLIFLTALDRGPVEQEVARFGFLTWTVMAVLGIGLTLAVFVQVRFGLRPLYALVQEVTDVRRGLTQRLKGRYPREIAPLADELNALLDHNREVVERQKTHVGNLAHALKTPLAVMLAESDASEGMLSDTVRKQAELMKAQVEHYLQRARVAARAQAGGQTTLVEETLDELASLLERVFHHKNIEIDWRAPESLAFRGERYDLQEVLGNLMENACKWCKHRVKVTAGASGTGRMAIVVEDDGPGLPADQREKVLKRGARLDETAPGTGLGLSIVDELIKAYAGTIELGSSPMGGLSVSLDLPMAEQPT